MFSKVYFTIFILLIYYYILMKKDSPKLKITKFCATIKIDIFMEDITNGENDNTKSNRKIY
ncbi:protein of unknown function [[Clostridium] ultunense Esp]|uniref:Uncharacterized protein n=1 Tax=[Clostridium] ultunense Esp TaxID=1288971 RepID=A0A1M4PPK8_9FIRM|nr:protein of unknown function [[Clostridium] ultunense Esp]